jgi:maltose O-acetyltransferase
MNPLKCEARKMQKKIKSAAALLYYALAQFLPQPPLPGGKFGDWLRKTLGEIIFLKCGKGIVVRKGAFFGTGAEIEIGDNSQIGDHAYLSRDVKIGHNVLMGQNVRILTTSHVFEDPTVTIFSQGYRERRPVHIGDDVWIGACSIILPGVTIGSGAVIGAGSVVTHDVAPLALVAGNPARFVRQRGSRLNPSATTELPPR